MFNKINTVLCLILSFHCSCKKVEEGFNTIEKTVICTDATINLVSAFNDYMAFPDPDNCNTLKDVSSYYVSNECKDTTGFGDVDINVRFILDSLMCITTPTLMFDVDLQKTYKFR
tara:strand:- start:1038 stop:1382 length:345 start_codon:yes stop_codon:yes gene_type:complete